MVMNTSRRWTENTPDFLLIGAMKSGTTTLWNDLRHQPAIFMPEQKEPRDLCFDVVLTSQGRARYVRLFQDARVDQLRGEASTYYTMLPEFRDVPRRAKAVCGSSLKLIYMVRNPILRALSHHRHSFIAGEMPGNVNDAVMSDARLVNYSRYAMQLEPWIDMFGIENVRVVKFEDYIAQRSMTVSELCTFLGVRFDPYAAERSAVKVLNKADDVVRLSAVGKSLRGSRLYQRVIRPFIPESMRGLLRRTVGSLPEGYCGDASRETLVAIVNSVRDDCERLVRLTGNDTLVWDFNSTMSELLARSGASRSLRE